MAEVLNLCFSIFKRNFSDSALFRRLVRAEIRENRRRILHKVMSAGLLVFTKPTTGAFCTRTPKKGAEIGETHERRKNEPERTVSAGNGAVASDGHATVAQGWSTVSAFFSDEQLGMIRGTCEFSLEDDATLSYAEEICFFIAPSIRTRLTQRITSR